jgi:hypothetical protein
MAPPEKPGKHKQPVKPNSHLVNNPDGPNPNISSDETSKLEVANIAKDLNKDLEASTHPAKNPAAGSKPGETKSQPDTAKVTTRGELNSDDTIYIDQEGTIHSVNEEKSEATADTNSNSAS